MMGYIMNYIQGIDPTAMTLPLAAYVIWGGTLVVILVVIVPLAVFLLHRTLIAAWSIRRYMNDMLTAGVGIAGNTSSIPALNDTIAVATDMVKTAQALEDHSGAIGEVLTQRAAGGTTS